MSFEIPTDGTEEFPDIFKKGVLAAFGARESSYVKGTKRQPYFEESVQVGVIRNQLWDELMKKFEESLLKGFDENERVQLFGREYQPGQRIIDSMWSDGRSIILMAPFLEDRVLSSEILGSEAYKMEATEVALKLKEAVIGERIREMRDSTPSLDGVANMQLSGLYENLFKKKMLTLAPERVIEVIKEWSRLGGGLSDSSFVEEINFYRKILGEANVR